MFGKFGWLKRKLMWFSSSSTGNGSDNGNDDDEDVDSVKNAKRRRLTSELNSINTNTNDTNAAPDERKVEYDESTLSELKTKVFLNSLILTSIAAQMSTSDLLKTRSTCKLWNHIMIPFVRARLKQRTLTIKEGNLSSLLDTYGPGAGATQILFSNYTLDSVQMHSPPVKILMKKFGPTLTSLKLFVGPTSFQLPINTFRHLILKGTPMLSSLEIADYRSYRSLSRFWKCKLQSPSSSSKTPDNNNDDQRLTTLPRLKRLGLAILSTEVTLHIHHISFDLFKDLITSSVNLEVVHVSNYINNPALQNSLNEAVSTALLLDTNTQGQLWNMVEKIPLDNIRTSMYSLKKKNNDDKNSS